VQDFCAKWVKEAVLPQSDKGLLAPVNGGARSKVKYDGRDSKKQGKAHTMEDTSSRNALMRYYCRLDELAIMLSRPSGAICRRHSYP
jgi:hypothetical protein